jgi:hypothetical protein
MRTCGTFGARITISCQRSGSTSPRRYILSIVNRDPYRRGTDSGGVGSIYRNIERKESYVVCKLEGIICAPSHELPDRLGVGCQSCVC